MNANLFRLVFNAARGQVMAVSEVATACGKSASGETRSSRVNTGSNQPQAAAECAQAAIKIIVLSIASVCTLWAIPSAQAQIVADTTAAGNLRPMVSTTANGVPQVNIQTPSAAGVSRNVYSQFDVKANGAVLNNSSANVQTQLGGWVQGNSNLASGAARVILNEVNSSNPSQLNGFVEVAGQRAEVIIANPAGIAVNGGGFINASGVTLTTGAPQLSGGNLDGYRVQTGNVSFSGAGLDASTADYTHIIARAVQVNAGIWAKDLKVTTGANTVNAANTSATAIAGSGSAPTVALDVAALGGMYANKITLVGTEAGLGVNNAGSIAARSGDLVLQANGMLTNTGSMAATGNANLSTTGALSNTGTLQTGGKLQASAQTITNAVGASITSADMELTAAGTLTNRGLISSGNAASDAKSRITATTVDNLGTGAIYGDHLGMSATTLNNKAESVSGTVTGATIGARTSLAIGVQTLNNSDMGLDTPANPSLGTTATASTNILSLGNITVGASLDAAGQAQGTAASINNTSASIQAGGHIVLNATAINNTDAHFASVNQTTTTAISETLGSVAGGWYANLSQQTDSGPVVTAALPGTISAAGDITLNAASVDNANSKILAGGTLTIPGAVTVNNAGITATKTVTKTGTAYTLVPDRSCQLLVKGNCMAWGPWYDTWPASAYSDTVASTVTVGAGSNTSGATTAAPGVQSAAVPNSSLYRINTSPVASYLVATNPAFTNYKTWLGSDYMLQSLTLDPSVTQKRLGDGFYEQRLLNEQVAQLTGRRFLGDYTSDDQQYRALMNAGVTYANAFNLRPGIALSAEQVAQLTSDIVWLQQETVILPDGSKTVALVPQVYLALRNGDLAPSGALLSGAALHITSSGDTTNTGTILGRNVVQINANTVNNLGGNIRGEAVAITAAQDINNTGGTITAQNQLTLDAGRDINSNSTTASATSSAGNSTVTNTTVDRVAGLYVTGEAGILLASAGRDINLIASIVSNSSANGQTVLGAQRDINLGTLQTSQTSNQERDSGNFRRATSTAEAGTTIQTPGNIRLEAANDITARAAQLSAGKTLDATAGNNIIVQAGQTTTQVDQMASASGSDLFTTSSIQTQRQSSSATAQRSTLGGQSVNVSAGNTLVSVGTEFKAGDRLKVEGKDQTLLYETQNVSQSSNTTHTTTTLTGLGAVALGGFGAQGLTLEDRTSTDQTASSVAIGTKLVSTQRIEIGVGNKTELRGTVVEAPQIAFVQTDPAKQGQLILGGSTNTTQTSHTEKTETAGVWQEQKGNGQTTQTLNQTQLKGNVQFDAALKITAQIPDTAGGQVLKTQINTLVSQGTGLDYLTQLSTNPSVEWDKVTLAHENWRYDQAGLTPAGAALLTVVVAYVTAGAGTAAVGTTAAGTTTVGATTLATTTATGALTYTATGVAINAGFTALASQTAVAMVNNGGDIGKTLEQLGKEDSIKNLMLTMATAGALDKLNANYFKGVDASSTFGTQLLKNVTNNLASASMDAAINGKPLTPGALANSLKSALINTGTAQGAFAIGDAKELGDIDAFTAKLAHAALGCAGGSATSGNCAAGAAGALAGELAAQYINPNADPSLGEKTIAFAKTISAVTGVFVGGGGDNAAAVNAAANAGANAAENNWLGDHQKAAMTKELRNAKTLVEQLQIQGKYFGISSKQDLLTATGLGVGLAEAGWSDVKGLAEFLKDPVTGFNGLKQLINDPQMRQAMGDQAFAALDQKIASMQTALSTGGDDAAIQMGKDLGGLIWQVGTVAMGVGGAAHAGVTLAKAGLAVGESGLDTMRLAAKILKTDVSGLGGVVDMVDTGMQFGKGIVGQGKPFEAFVQSKLPPGTLDLNSIKQNFSTFDHLTPDGVAISTKTLDTAATTYQNPSKITGAINRYVDDMVEFAQDGKKGGAFQLKSTDIAVKQMQLGIPANASADQLSAIAQSIRYAESKGIQIVVTKVK